MRWVREKDFNNPPEESKKCTKKFKESYLDGNDDSRVKSNCYKKANKHLNDLYHGKCSYCELFINRNSYIRVDHYRPKSVYKWLIFEWSNLVSSCERCNIKKSNLFPISTGHSRVLQGVPGTKEARADSQTLKSEMPLLLHPELDNPGEHLEFRWYGTINEKKNSLRGKTTIQVCQLNRSDLVAARKEQINGIFSNIEFLTTKIVGIYNKDRTLFLGKEKFWFSLYWKTFNEMEKLCAPQNQNAFTLLGLSMHKEFEYFIVCRLPENEDMRNIVRKAFSLFKKGKLDHSEY